VKQEMMGWEWHQQDHKQIICTSLHRDNHASTSSLNFFTGRMLFLTPNRQSTEGKTLTYMNQINYKQVSTISWRHQHTESIPRKEDAEEV